MNTRVVCINDTNLPNGAEVVKGDEYTVLDKFINSYDQVVYIIEGVSNEGRTRFGLPWRGYAATRFKVIEGFEKVEQMIEHILN